jgi:8-oxo-dGTP pyrophosphatase MutT (NUDIX family)
MNEDQNLMTSGNTIRRVAIAILQYQDKFLMQLRDDIPTIVHPGVWTMFGGHLEINEEPEIGVCRELQEEIGYVPQQISHFRTYSDDLPLGDRVSGDRALGDRALNNRVIRHVFYGCLDVGLNMLELNEGWDMDLLSLSEIIKGSHYSAQALQERPIAPSHRQIMLDFLSSPECHTALCAKLNPR